MGTAQGPPNLVDSGMSYGPILTKHSEPRMDDLLSPKNDGQAFFFLIKKKMFWPCCAVYRILVP